MRWDRDDASRPLSDKGQRQAERLGRVLAAYSEAPDLFVTSPKVRAAQTAEIVARALGKVTVVVDERLGWGVDLASLPEILRAAGPAERPCLVGHDPDFSELLGELLGTPPVPMRKGAIARVDVADISNPAGGGVLRYLLPPELLPK